MFAPPGAGGPAAPGIGLIDFEDDYDSEEDAPKAAAPMPSNNPGSAGGRPMVGGFAAAAYEAAKAHHFAQQQAKAAKAAAQFSGTLACLFPSAGCLLTASCAAPAEKIEFLGEVEEKTKRYSEDGQHDAHQEPPGAMSGTPRI